MKTWLKPIKDLGACEEALVWAKQFASLDEAWLRCERGNWMLWLAGRLSGKRESLARKKVVLAVCQCARLALPYVRKGELRPLQAIETAEKWAKGDDSITLEELDAAGEAAWAAGVAAREAARAAAWAAVAAAVAAAGAAAWAAGAAARAAAWAAVAAAREAALKQCADIVRSYYPTAPKQ